MKTNKIFAIASFCLMLLLFSACEWFEHHASPKKCMIEEPFTLEYGQSIECEDWEITFEGEIQDSRCPQDVVCVWAGRVDIELQMGGQEVALGLPDDPELGQSKDTLDDMVIELLEVLPVPLADQETPESDYRIKLVLTDL